MGSISSEEPVWEDILSKRRSSNDFRWASRPFSPSPYFVRGSVKTDPKGLIRDVLGSSRVRLAIKEVAEKEKKDEKEVGKRALGILAEMGHDYHLYTVRWFGYVLSKLAKNHYSSIYINTKKLEGIKECFQRYPVILLPTHRSYVDFLLLSYVCFSFDMPLPIIAAGMDFMGMMGVAELLRKAGAFFIRRRFGNDSLYWSLISEYVKRAVLFGNHPLEMFVEGTRSRTGKSLYPKIGLLTTIAELVRNRELPDVLVLPISMSYDRTLEETLYARELLGQPKPKESTNGLIKGLRWLGSQSYGSMYVNFGELISIREYLGEPLSPAYLDDFAFSKTVQQIAIDAVLDQQKHLVTPLFSAVATVLLAQIAEGERSIGFTKLMQHIHSFRSLITPNGSDFGNPLFGETLEWNLRHILSIHSSLVLCPKHEEHLVHLQVGSEDETIVGMKLQHYANQFLPMILPYSLFVILLKENGDLVSVEDIIHDYKFLRELLFDDFIYVKGTELEEATKCSIIFNLYLTKGRKNGQLKEWIAATEELRKILRIAIEPFLLAYWGVAKTLLQLQGAQETAIEVKLLGKMSQGFLRQLIGTIFPTHYGSLSLDTLNNAAMAFIKMHFVDKVKLENSFGLAVNNVDLLSSLLTRIEEYLPNTNVKNSDDSELLHLKAKL